MADVLSPKQRAYCMSRIQGKNTKPELALRKALWAAGFRHRVKNKLPGKPNIVYSYIRTVIFVDGCFWHRCPEHYQPPKTRAEFWKNKISKNVERDKRNNQLLEDMGWYVIRVWEHEIKESLPDVINKIESVLQYRKITSE